MTKGSFCSQIYYSRTMGSQAMVVNIPKNGLVRGACAKSHMWSCGPITALYPSL